MHEYKQQQQQDMAYCDWSLYTTTIQELESV